METERYMYAELENQSGSGRLVSGRERAAGERYSGRAGRRRSSAAAAGEHSGGGVERSSGGIRGGAGAAGGGRGGKDDRIGELYSLVQPDGSARRLRPRAALSTTAMAPHGTRRRRREGRRPPQSSLASRRPRQASWPPPRCVDEAVAIHNAQGKKERGRETRGKWECARHPDMSGLCRPHADSAVRIKPGQNQSTYFNLFWLVKRRRISGLGWGTIL